MDTGSLRASRPFRRLTAGQLVSVVGRQVTVVAVPYQVYLLTHSAVAIGLIGLAQAVPLILSSLLAGSLADRLDRRRLLLVTQTLLAACSTLLLLGALLHTRVWVVFAVVAVAAAIGAVDSPTRSAVIPNLVSPEHLAGALAINMALFATALIAGPALGGLVIARFGLTGAYSVDVATYAAALLAVWLLPPQRPRGTTGESTLQSLQRGWAYVRRHRLLMGTFAMDLSAMIFGLPRALFPVLALTTFHTGATGLGLLYAAPGAGAVVATLLSGWLSRTVRMGRAVVVAIAAWGVAIVAFGFVRSLGPGLLLLVVAGTADTFSAVGRSTIMQTVTPDGFRGRVSAAYFMVVAGGPYLGDLESGVVAGLVTAQVSVVSGGLLSLAGLGAAALAFPQVWRYRHEGRAPATALSDDAATQGI